MFAGDDVCILTHRFACRRVRVIFFFLIVYICVECKQWVVEGDDVPFLMNGCSRRHIQFFVSRIS